MDLRRVIRDRMDELGMTQARLSELTGSTRPRICTFLSGKRGVNTETLENWLKVPTPAQAPQTERTMNDGERIQ